MNDYIFQNEISSFEEVEMKIQKNEKEKPKNKKINKIEADVVHVLKNKTIIKIEDFGFVIKGIYNKEKVEIEYDGTLGKDFKIINIK